ncbi:MAG: SIS domain-containing protein [Thermodesulfobacteriota bacterium]|nr:SIS domain-containing protein [Thermodesulfobacteriota bacterium]
MCGIVGIVPVNRSSTDRGQVGITEIERLVAEIERRSYHQCLSDGVCIRDEYLGGETAVRELAAHACALKSDTSFFYIYGHSDIYNSLQGVSARLKAAADREVDTLDEAIGLIDAETADILRQRLESVKDIWWCLETEVCANIVRVNALTTSDKSLPPASVSLLKKINAVFNSLDRLEVRGRDSAGISVIINLTPEVYERFEAAVREAGLGPGLDARSGGDVLINNAVSCCKQANGHVSMAFVYKYAAEIGSLGDNIRFLRSQITSDRIFQHLLAVPHAACTISAHTRWASVGTISEANCHPLDNKIVGGGSNDGFSTGGAGAPIIHVCLNGDIDNYQDLKAEHDAGKEQIPAPITTDTKIIPLRIQKYLNDGNDVETAFRLAVSDFTGAHAISMHTDLAPGKIFFAQKGSGQALFVGMAPDHYIVASELYGVVEETARFVKMNAGSRGGDADTPGQIVILDQQGGGLDGIKAMYYDGSPAVFQDRDIKTTAITSRDVDRQGFAHYFLKEISEAPVSIENTLYNRWKIKDGEKSHYEIMLGEDVISPELSGALNQDAIRRIFFIGQGTAGVAALACAGTLNYYFSDPQIHVCALKASELSGFTLEEDAGGNSMKDTLVVAISQSGTTTDTNRTLDMVRKYGAHTIAIVNRRDSDITFKVDGVLYTSTGRDIEMSVASTKAFYSQVVAGALLGLYLAERRGTIDSAFVTSEIKQMLRLPSCLKKIFENRDKIMRSARRLSSTKTYWAAVGSGPNKAAADEIRIKLSELCYKTISSDFVEDKKHIDLSAEPLIIVCAAGSRVGVLDDIIKDTAIFRAHKAAPVIIADEGEYRFNPHAEDVIHVPQVAEHFGPIVNTFAGHLWGYYAALAINEGSRLLHEFRESLRREIDDYTRQGLDVFEIVLEKGFKEKIAEFYSRFREKRNDPELPAYICLASDLALLLKYLSGRLPLSDFKLDFGKKGTAPNILDVLFTFLGESINQMARPVDAIKHQAKTVTVGTSRIKETMEGILFDTLASFGMDINQLSNSNIVVLKNVQKIVSEIKGAILYEIDNLNILGEPTDDTTIHIVEKQGVLAPIASRVETDNRLKGTKKIIAREGNVYIGKGRKDERHIIVIPVLSSSPAKGGVIRHMLLLNIGFRQNASLYDKKKALGGKCERIKNIVQENNVIWSEEFIQLVDIKDLFGKSAEKVAETIVEKVEEKNTD